VESQGVHHLVHDEGGSSHVPRILKKGDTEKEDEYIWEKYSHSAYSADNSIDNEVREEPFAHEVSNEPREEPHSGINPIHGILSHTESQLEHGPDKEDENRETEQAIRQDRINLVGEIAPVSRSPTESLLKGTVDEAISAIGH